MASCSSWFKSVLSPAKNWVAFSNRLRDYGFAFGCVFKPDQGQSIKSEESLLKTKTFPNLEEVEKIIGYNFNNPSLLQQAFTHPSYDKNAVSYERLEYVGDSVLTLLVTKLQFCTYPNLSPGFLSPLRAANIDTEKLARAAVMHGLHRYLRHRTPLINRRVRAFVTAIPHYPLHSYGLINVPKFLADIVESTLGAVFIDSNSSIDTTWKVAKDLLEPIITPEMLKTNPVRKLNEICQKNKLKVRFVDRWLQQGAYEVFVDNQFKGRGKCRISKDVALNRAARDAYDEILTSLAVKGWVNNNYS